MQWLQGEYRFPQHIPCMTSPSQLPKHLIALTQLVSCFHVAPTYLCFLLRGMLQTTTFLLRIGLCSSETASWLVMLLSVSDFRARQQQGFSRSGTLMFCGTIVDHLKGFTCSRWPEVDNPKWYILCEYSEVDHQKWFTWRIWHKVDQLKWFTMF